MTDINVIDAVHALVLCAQTPGVTGATLEHWAQAKPTEPPKQLALEL